MHVVARFLAPLLRTLFPATGRHRATTPAAVQTLSTRPATPQPPARTTAPAPCGALVRPYALTPDEFHERRLQRQRRRQLWLATVGVDAGPRRIHGVEVLAR